jgi:hypothetical protein
VHRVHGLERYFLVRTGRHCIGDIRGNRTFGSQAGAPGLTEIWAAVPSRDQAIRTILRHTSEQP